MKNQSRYKILLLVDPTEPELKPTAAAISWLKEWIGHQDTFIEAVYVSPEHGKNQSVNEAHFFDFVNNLHLGKNAHAKVLYEKTSSRRKAVHTLIDYSNSIGVNLIVVASHGRSGLGRLVLGSFAESVLASATVPVLFLDQHSERHMHTKKILFPTDLSAGSKIALGIFLDEIKGFKGELILYHAVSPPGAILDTAVLGLPVFVPQDYWSERREWAEAECELLLRQVSESGINGMLAIHDGIVDTASAIQVVAQDQNIDLIAMASVSGEFDSSVAGNVTEAIFRSRKWPVWVCGPGVLGKK